MGRRLWTLLGTTAAGLVITIVLFGFDQWNAVKDHREQETRHMEVTMGLDRLASVHDQDRKDTAPDTSDDSAEVEVGWGPGREVFTMGVPSSYVVLNSITDHSVHGDERNFVQVKRLGAPSSEYAETASGGAGDRFQVYMWVANDLADNFAGLSGTVQGLRAHVATGGSGHRNYISITLSALNATSVWDGAYVYGERGLQLRAVPDSARFRTTTAEYDIEGDPGSSEGFLLGQDRPDGGLPVGSRDGKSLGHGYLTFEVELVAR